MTGWQWHQLDYMQVICTSLQRDNHASTPSFKFLTGWMLFLPPNQQHQRFRVLKASWQCIEKCHKITWYKYINTSLLQNRALKLNVAWWEISLTWHFWMVTGCPSTVPGCRHKVLPLISLSTYSVWLDVSRLSLTRIKNKTHNFQLHK